jgi:hypothetical protein
VTLGYARFLLLKCRGFKDGVDHRRGLGVGNAAAMDGYCGNLEFLVVRQFDLPQLERSWFGDSLTAALA